MDPCRTLPLRLAFLAIIGPVAPTQPASAVDLSVASIEVTQAVQTESNAVTLVAQRNTEVRVTVGVTGASVPVPNVTGRVKVFIGGVEVWRPLFPASFTAPISPDRNNEGDTLNFSIPGSVFSVSTNVDIEVEIDPVPFELVTSNNTGELTDLTFARRCNPKIYFTLVSYPPGGLGIPSYADVADGVGDVFVEGIYPFTSGDVGLYEEGPFSTRFTDDPDGDGMIDGGDNDGSDDGSSLLADLESQRQLIVSLGYGASDKTFLYGWLAGNPIPGNGLGQISGFTAFGNTEHIRYQRTFAHELGHNFGLSHNTRTLVETGWDVFGFLEGNPATNNTTGSVKPDFLFDIMVGGKLTNNAWVDTTTYNFFLASPVVGCYDAFFVAEAVVIAGIFDPLGNQLTRLHPAFRYPWLAEPTPPWRQSGPFAVEVVDDLGHVTTVPFDAKVGTDGGGDSYGFFRVTVPVPAGRDLASVRITDSFGQQEYGGFSQPSVPPVVQMIQPNPGDSLGTTTAVAWSVQDPDTPLPGLMYQVAYSWDDGSSWVPVRVNVAGTQTGLVFDSARIPSANGTGVIRVFASDGLNTSSGAVGGLTTLASIFPTSTPQLRGDEDGATLVFPNPFIESTSVSFTLGRVEHVRIRVYDLGGRSVTTIHDGRVGPGAHLFNWDGRDARQRPVAAGVYFVRIELGEATTTHRVTRLQ
jgi:hypothetical protein